MTVLTRTYCAFCEVVADLYNNFKTCVTPTFDRKTYNQLASLTDRELNDMGISRGDIGNIARGISVPRDGWRR
jgi:hypothetical protein